MDQKKKHSGKGSHQDGNQRSQQTGQPDWNQSQNPNRDQRDQPDKTRQEMPGRDQPGQRYTQDQDDNRGNQKPQSPPERGTKSERNSERNSSSSVGISNRGMDSEEEQEDLPERGSRQSER
jgi:hypothetical protein